MKSLHKQASSAQVHDRINRFLQLSQAQCKTPTESTFNKVLATSELLSLKSFAIPVKEIHLDCCQIRRIMMDQKAIKWEGQAHQCPANFRNN